MTIDEAIRHAEEVAQRQDIKDDEEELFSEMLGDMYGEFKMNCTNCAEEHRQLATWLRELKELRNSVGGVKLSNMKEALASIRTLKAELNGWKEDPFGIIAEVCRTRSCKLCQWEEKCPYAGKYEYHPEDWRAENGI